MNAITTANTLTVTVKSFFKKAKAGANIGKKRADMNWSFAGVNAAGVADLPADQVARVVNGFIESYGRKLIAAAGDDWDFAPTVDTCTFELAYADLTAARTNNRVLTKETLTKLGDLYLAVMVRSGTVEVKAANTVRSLIIDKFASVMGKTDVLAVLRNRVDQFCDHATEEELESIAEVVEAVAALLDELAAPQEVTVDSI